jgi:hypothetical protein
MVETHRANEESGYRKENIVKENYFRRTGFRCEIDWLSAITKHIYAILYRQIRPPL